MTQAINRYKADLRDLKFLLFEQFKTGELLGSEPFGDWSREDVEMILEEVYRWACDKLGPLNSVGDRQGCKLEGGKVKTPDGFKAAWDELHEVGFNRLAVPEEHGGQGGPLAVGLAAGELMTGANVSFMMYPGLADGVARLLEAFGTDAQKHYIDKLHEGIWGGTMCLTEPQAGSDVGAASTKATPLGDGRYKIEGTKIFISGGDHDLTENIIHLVLARTPDAPSGTKGLSLFIVPRERFDGSGSNHVVTASLEHKMGINGSATAVLNFGEGGDCIGELVGGKEQHGIKQMFNMMNGARIEVGLQGLAIAGTAYLNALEYAKDRKQGPSVKDWKDADAPKVAIIEHPDVRRMLLDMKSKVEGVRALIHKLGAHWDRLALARGRDEEAASYHQGQLDLLVPLVKADGSGQAYAVSTTAIQVFGGAGYLKDWPVEQYCRDSKIFSIYEGTNHIQALDLVSRKLGQRGGANFKTFLADVGGFIAAHKEHPKLGTSVLALAGAVEALGATAMRFLGWFQAGEMTLVPLNANRFLEMMSETTVAWLLLDAAVIADHAASALAGDHKDQAFYAGKIASAVFYAEEVLPNVKKNAVVIGKGGRTALEIADESFGSI